MPPKRSNAKPGPTAPAAAPSGPLLNTLLVAGAVGYAGHLLVRAGALRWPPTELLDASTTIVGCLAMVGPLILWRRSEAALGDLVWLGGGLCFWVVNLATLARGRSPGASWVDPIEPTMMGAFALAIGLTAWQAGRARWAWTWTSIAGCLLGLFWVGTALAAALPPEWTGGSTIDARLPRLGSVLP